MTERQNPDWRTILTVVAMLCTFVSYAINFSNRVAKTEASIEATTQRLDRIEDKIDRLIERKGEK